MQKIMAKYNLPGEIIKIENYGFGHINKTIKITAINNNQTYEYILQKINNTLFKKVNKLMKNINYVSCHLKTKLQEENHITSKVLTIIKTKQGKTYYKHKGKYYRIYEFIDNSICLQKTTNPKVFELVGKAFGEFTNDLADFDAKKLYNILPNFHNTKERLKTYLKAYKKDKLYRKQNIKQIHSQIIKRQKYATIIVEKEKNNLLPVRTTHNDTKLNNIILNANTNSPLAILDLDTVMPSTILYDFGDAIRYGCNIAGEEETKLKNIKFDLKLFESFTKGYLSKTKNILTSEELETLAISPLVITYELCLRFLTEYLNGDKYFKSKYEGQNLKRAKVQMKLLIEMEKNYKKMQKIIKKHAK